MRKRTFLHVVTLVVMCLSAFGVGTATAGPTGGERVVVTAARICEDQSLEVRWIGSMADLRVSASNTSDNWTSGWMHIPDLDAGIYSIPLGRNFDKVVVQAQNPISGEYYEEDTITIDTGTCADGAEEPRGDWKVADVALTCSGLATVTIMFPETIQDSAYVGLLLHENGSPVNVGEVPFPLTTGQAEYQHQFDTSEWQLGAEIQVSTFVLPMGSNHLPVYSSVITCDEVAPEPETITLSGTVTEKDAEPAEGIYVCAYQGEISVGCSRTDVGGFYSLNLNRGESFDIRISSFSHQPVSSTILNVESNITLDFELERLPVGYLTGVVTDTHGNPIPNAEFVIPAIKGEEYAVIWTTDTYGRFETETYVVGWYPMVNEAGGYNLLRAEGCTPWEVSQGPKIEHSGANDIGVIELECGDTYVPDSIATVTPDATETPEVTPTETAPPTEEPTETETPVIGNALIITIAMPDGASIEGAPYDLFAAQPSVEFQTEPYRSGVVGANNTIEIDDLLPGTYKLVISPEEMAPIEAIIEIGDQPLTEVRLTVNADGSVTIGDVAQVTPTSPAGESKTENVTGLPSTGAGEISGSMGVMVMLAVAASALLMAGGLAVRQKRG